MSADRAILYSYWRSTAAYRVRIALELKGIDWEYRAVDLVKGGGEQHEAVYRELNPSGLVPTLVMGDAIITQSLAICEYLEDLQSAPALLPADPAHRAWVRAIALDVACDIHPLNNLRVQQYLGREMGQDEQARLDWMHHWMRKGFDGVEEQLATAGLSGKYCYADRPGLADIFLVGQAYNADRFGLDLAPWPRIRATVDLCRDLPAFRSADPAAQPDAPA